MNWKERLYQNYVSTGQAPKPEAATVLFEPQAPYIKRVIHLYIPQDRRARIVDLGCGHGIFLYFLRQAGYTNLEGIDVSSEQVNLGHRLGISEIKQGVLLQYLVDQPAESVAIVLLMDILEHFTRQELFDTLDAAFRVMRPGGKCIIHVPNADGLFGMGVRYGDLTHELAFTPRSMHQALTAVGFGNVRSFEDRPVVHGWWSVVRRIVWQIGTVYPRIILMAETGNRSAILSRNMLITAEKPTRPVG